MDIILYQIEGQTCRFIYKANGIYSVVTVENNYGMLPFLSQSCNARISNEEDILEHLNMLKAKTVIDKF